MDLVELFDRSRRQFSDSEAVVCGAGRLTYRQLGERVEALAASLTRLGVGDGARVAILEKNCHRHVEAYLAAARSGSVLVPINYRLAPAEQTEILVESPRSVDFVETLPRTATGKINKRELSRAMRSLAATARRDEDQNRATTL